MSDCTCIRGDDGQVKVPRCRCPQHGWTDTPAPAPALTDEQMTTDRALGTNLTRTVREALAAALTSNGVGRSAPDGIHSWRCEYPNVYGPCTCFAELLDDLVAAVTPRLDAAEKVVEAAEALNVEMDSLIIDGLSTPGQHAASALGAALDAWRGGEGHE